MEQKEDEEEKEGEEEEAEEEGCPALGSVLGCRWHFPEVEIEGLRSPVQKARWCGLLWK